MMKRHVVSLTGMIQERHYWRSTLITFPEATIIKICSWPDRGVLTNERDQSAAA